MDIIWKIVNFIILFGALYFICRKMNLFDKMFGSRRRGIGEEIENSEKAKAQAKALGEDIEKARSENEERKQQLLNDAEAQAKADGALSRMPKRAKASLWLRCATECRPTLCAAWLR